MRIAFTYNIKPEGIKATDKEAEFFAEFDPPETIEGIKKAIEANGHEVTMVEANEDAYEKLRQNRDRIDLVFNFAEAVTNTEDREAHIPMFAEILKIPYTGPRPLVAAIILDKAKTKEVLSYHKVPNPRFQLFNTGEEKIEAGLKFPLIVKPNSEGSSQGIKNNAVVDSEKELRERVAEVKRDFGQGVIVEEFLPGREFTVSIIGNGENLEVLPIMEFSYEGLPEEITKIDGYEAKWAWDHEANKIEQESTCPAKLEKELEKEIVEVAKKAFRAVECRDWARIDIRLDENNKPFVLEVNCPAGLQPDPRVHSCMPIAAKAAGINFEQLIGKIIDTALARYGKLKVDA